MKKKPSYQVAQQSLKGINLPKIETVKNLYSGREYDVHIENPEFTCLCPKTGLPDFANIIIDYCPAEKLIELKSLKYYFLGYRNLGVFHEFLANKVLDDLVKVSNPQKMKVTATFNTRGGINATVSATYPQ